MNSIRKLLAVGTGTVALCAVIAFALAPVTVLAEGTHQWGFWRGSERQELNPNRGDPVAGVLGCAADDQGRP